MTTLKVKDLAKIKTTGETVFVLSIASVDTGIEPCAERVTVRRPIFAADGCRHVTEDFYADEIETIDEFRDRKAAEIKANMAAAGMDVGGGSFGINVEEAASALQ